MKRREFINLSLVGGSSLIIGINYSCFSSNNKNPNPSLKKIFDPFVEIFSNGKIHIYAPVPELGQGTRTSLPMILAEELDANWEDIIVKQAAANEKYGNMAAAGSTSVERFYDPLRKVGAGIREMFKEAAISLWNIKMENLSTKNSMVRNMITGEEKSYAELVELVSTKEPPLEVKLKDVSQFNLIGKSKNIVDLNDIVTGKAEYGIDGWMENMKYATVVRCPVRGGTVAQYNAEKALGVKGVLNIFEVKPYRPIPYAEVLSGVAIIAENTSAALKARNLLSIQWNYGDTQKENSSYYKETYQKLKKNSPEIELRNTPAFEEKLELSEKNLEFDYEIPFWAHYCMEPMNFLAHFKESECILKGPSQRPRLIQNLISQIYEIPLEKVVVQTTLVGGGFGRRLAVDYAMEAVIISKESGYPVKVIWTREDDVLHDYFRTISFHHLKVGLNQNKINSWYHHIMTKPIGEGAVYEVQGAADLPFQIPNIQIGYSEIPSGIQIGSWRSVAHTYNSFVVNNTITEIAETLNKDPYEFYLDILGDQEIVTVKLPFAGYRGEVLCDTQRLKTVLNKVVELSDWKTRSKKNNQYGLGIACAFYKTSYAAHVVEVQKVNGNFRVKKVFAVLDSGRIINPSGVKAQIEGSISDAITVSLKSSITIEEGIPQEINFDKYDVTRMKDLPEIELYIINSENEPSGAGEPPFPSVAPAIANAVHRLTGNKIRTLPII